MTNTTELEEKIRGWKSELVVLATRALGLRAAVRSTGCLASSLTLALETERACSLASMVREAHGTCLARR